MTTEKNWKELSFFVKERPFFPNPWTWHVPLVTQYLWQIASFHKPAQVVLSLNAALCSPSPNISITWLMVWFDQWLHKPGCIFLVFSALSWCWPLIFVSCPFHLWFIFCSTHPYVCWCVCPDVMFCVCAPAVVICDILDAFAPSPGDGPAAVAAGPAADAFAGSGGWQNRFLCDFLSECESF